jgi:hypothetical protein
MCGICCEYQTSYIICSYCKFQACEICNQKFIEDRPREPLCMNCGKIWTREFVLQNVNDKKRFLRHIGKFILEQEKMLLPGTQEEASHIYHIQELSRYLKTIPTNNRLKRMFKSRGREALTKVIEEKQELLRDVRNSISLLKSETLTYGGDISVQKDKNIHYIFKCPMDCRGFVSNDYTCGTCKSIFCKRCRVQIEDSAHTCIEDDIKSTSLISNLTKPCPKCMTPILKASGCDQMFCVLCHAVFSWTTGELEMGVVHNPHYYEYLSTLPMTRDIEMIACGEVPDAYTFMVNVVSVAPSLYRNNLRSMHNVMTHINHNIIPRWRVDKVKDNIDIRVEYLLEEIDEPTWELKLLNREKKRMKIKAFQDLLQMILAVLEDFVRRVFSFDTSDYNKWNDSIFETLKEFISLYDYYQNSLSQICKVHGGSIPRELFTAFRVRYT